MAKKSDKTPSRPADGIGGCSPCVYTLDTRWTSRLRRVSLVLAHGKEVSFAVCLAADTRRIIWSVRRVHFIGTRRTRFPGTSNGHFAVCLVPGTRQSDQIDPFFCFSHIKDPIPQHIYHSHYISHIYHNKHHTHNISQYISQLARNNFKHIQKSNAKSRSSHIHIQKFTNT